MAARAYLTSVAGYVRADDPCIEDLTSRFDQWLTSQGCESITVCEAGVPAHIAEDYSALCHLTFRNEKHHSAGGDAFDFATDVRPDLEAE